MSDAPLSDPARATTVIYVDTARDRNQPVVGRQLLRRLLRRVFGAAAVTIGAMCLAWVGSTPLPRLIGIWVVGFLTFSILYLLFYGALLIDDYWKKRDLSETYGFDRRFGLDTYQRRVLRIEAPPADLPERITQALEAIDPDAKIRPIDGNRFEAKLRRRGNRGSCRVTFHIGPDGPGGRTVTVESKLTEVLGFNDLGRNIINVEEFQRALVRLLGAEQRSLTTRATTEREGTVRDADPTRG